MPLMTFGQDLPQLKLSNNGVEPIVIESEGLSANELYSKSLNWVQETYKTPSKALKANILNQKIRVDGFVRNAWWYKSLGVSFSYDIEYTVEISFKDGRYRFEYIVGDSYTEDGVKVLFNNKTWFKKNGEIKKSFIPAVASLEETMNNLSQSFYSYVSGKSIEDDSDW